MNGIIKSKRIGQTTSDPIATLKSLRNQEGNSEFYKKLLDKAIAEAESKKKEDAGSNATSSGYVSLDRYNEIIKNIQSHQNRVESVGAVIDALNNIEDKFMANYKNIKTVREDLQPFIQNGQFVTNEDSIKLMEQLESLNSNFDGYIEKFQKILSEGFDGVHK